MIADPLVNVRKTPKYLSSILDTQQYNITVDLSANENALGPSPNAIRAFQESVADLWRYPDGSQQAIRQAIAEHYGLAINRITCGAGSDELITLLARLYLSSGDEMLYSEYGFAMYPINAIRLGAIPIKAPAKDLGADVRALVESITPKTKIIFLANPNNPTGTYITASELQYLAEHTPANVILVIDSAYAEYVEKADYDDGIGLVDKYPNLIMLRTFSKMYALASLRLGWCYASEEIIDLIERSRNPYNVNGPAQAAGIAALAHSDYVSKACQHNTNWLDKLTQSMQQMGIGVQSSVCNFVLANFHSSRNANRAYEYLLQQGIFTRPLNGYDLPSYLRITIGRDADNEYLIEKLKQF